MAKRSKSELGFIKSFVDGTYNRLGNVLYVDTSKEYDPSDPESALGYCFKHTDPINKNVIYQIKCSRIGIEPTDFRIMMHEYGHIYLGQLDGIHEELDSVIVSAFNDHRGEIIERINTNCGIDFADKLIERVIDDPYLNHELHNIAMDMEVNSKILSDEDVDEMEMDITSVLPKYQEKALEYLRDKAEDEEVKKTLGDILKKMEKSAKIKFILPSRFHTGIDSQGNPIPFPNELTYVEYLMLIIDNLDQFVKMLVSINLGGNGDTSKITKEMVQQALQNYMNQRNQEKSDEYKKGFQDAIKDYNNGTPGQSQQKMNQGQGADQQNSSENGEGSSENGEGEGEGSQPQNGSGNQSGDGGMTPQQMSDYNQGYQDGMNQATNSGGSSGMSSLNSLMGDCGLSSGDSDGNGTDSDSDGNSESGSGGSGSGRKYQGMRKDPTKQDHRTDSRDDADIKRKMGKIKNSGGVGCGDSGGPDLTREVEKDVDPVEMALTEVMQNVKAKVIKQEIKRDVMKLYNRGIIRSVIAPSVSKKVTVTVDPKLVYLIDVSGSMNTRLIDRILKSIGKSMMKLNRGLRYDIITWSTHLGEHIKNIDPKKGIPRISSGGGTSMADGIKYFKDNYGPEAILIVISDFEDYLEEWHKVELTMPEYDLWGFNYGNDSWQDSKAIDWKNMKIRRFNDR